MADSGMTDNRNSSAQIDDDDPLMELSRIIGLEPRRESVSRYAPAPRAEPDFGAPEDAEALELPAQPEISDVLQQDLADELIASLESEDDFSALDDQEPAAEPAMSGDGAVSEPDFEPAAYAEEPVPHIELPSASSSPVQGTLEDELEAILNPEAARHFPFGIRPLDAEPEEIPAQGEEFAELALETEAAETGPEAEPVLALDEETEFAEEAREEEPYAEPELEAAQTSSPETLEAEESDYWSRVARRAQNVPAYAPEIEPDAVSETRYHDEEPVELAPEADAAEIAAPSVLQFEPLVDIIAHEARGVEMTGELEVPEFDYDIEEKPQDAAASGDDYDPEYGSSYRQPNGGEAPAPSMPAARYEDDDYDQIDEATAELEQERDYGAAGLGLAGPAAAGLAMAARQTQPRREFVLNDEDNFGASLDVPQAPAAARRGAGRSYLMAAGLGAIALLGGIGAFALTRGGDSSASTAAAPVVIKADSGPVKVAPETPGGKVVPNQDIAVFDKAAGEKLVEAAQTELVSATETPVDLAAKAAPRVVLPGPAKTDPALQEAAAETAMPEAGAKSEERVAELPEDEVSLIKTEVASVSPKKVRTMVVKSDGSLEERAAAPAAAAPALDPVETALAAPTESAVPAKKVQTSAIVPDETVGAVAKAADPAAAKVEEIVTAAAAPETAADPVAEAAPAAAEAAPAEVKTDAVKPVKVKKLTQKAAKAEALKEVAAANIPLVDGRPSDQPVTIVAKTGKTPQAAEEVAALAPAPAAAGGSYVIQIASAPTPDAAQATYASLNRKFGNVIGGRNMRIQKADIPGKGTFYRVRIAAGSKKEAAALCAKYKSAGGQCLVAR